MIKNLTKKCLFICLCLFLYQFAYTQCSTANGFAVVNSAVIASSVDDGLGTCTFSLEVSITKATGNGSVELDVSADGTSISTSCLSPTGSGLTVVTINGLDANCTANITASYTGYDRNSCSTSGNGSTCVGGEVVVEGSLPVNLISFQGKLIEQKNIGLSWATATEEQNELFVLERSTDGRNFMELTQIEGNGTTNSVQSYSYMDESPQRGTNYYRLNQIDYNGQSSLSEIISVEFSGIGSEKPFEIINTLAQEELTLAIGQDYQTELLSIQLFSINGIHIKTFEVPSGNSNFSYDISSLENGIYVLRSTSGSESLAQKFMKLN